MTIPSSRTAEAMRHCALFVLLLLMLTGAQAQSKKEQLKIYGKILVESSQKRLKGAQITIENTDRRTAETIVATRGKYKAYLEYGYVFRLIYSYDGYVTKVVEVDTRDVPPAMQLKQSMEIEVDLFEHIPGLNMSVMRAPLSRARYKRTTLNMGWDTDYYRQRLAEIEAERARARATRNQGSSDR